MKSGTEAGCWQTQGFELIAFGLLAVLVTVAYANSLPAGFAFDDEVMIRQNPLITSLDHVPKLLASDYWAGRRPATEAVPWRSGLYRPLVSLTYALNYAAGKDNPVGYHTVNLLLHLLVSWLVYLIALRTGISRAGGMVAAGIFGVHPIHTEAVTSIVGRAELLMAAGVLGAVWLAGVGRPWLSLIAFASALLSKEQAIMLPAVLVLYDLCVGPLSGGERRQSTSNVRILSRYGGYLAILACYAALHAAVVGGPGMVPIPFIDNPLAHVDGSTRVFSALKVAGWYLWLCVWPSNLSADYSYNAIPLSSSAADLGILGGMLAWGLLLGLGAWSFVKSDRTACFAVGLLVLTFLPVSNLVVPIGTIMGERLFYLPSAGLCLLAGLGWDRLIRGSCNVTGCRRLIQSGAALGLVAVWVLLTLRTVDRNRDWADSETLMRSAEAVVPTSSKVHTVLADIAIRKADWSSALSHLQTAMGLYPGFTSTEVAINLKLGIIFLNTGREDDAIVAFERAVALDPFSSLPRFYLGTGYVMGRRYEEAEASLRHALSLNPEAPEARSSLSWVLNVQGRYEEALREAEAALRLQPDLREGRLNRARALQGLSRSQEAVEEFQRAGSSILEPGFLGGRRR